MSFRRSYLVFVLLLPLVIGVLALSTSVRTARSYDLVLQSAPDAGEDPFNIEVVRVFYTDRDLVPRLHAWKALWEINEQAQYFIVEVSPAEKQWLLDLGLEVVVDAKLTANYSGPNALLPAQVDGIPGYPCYRTVEETFATAEQIVAAYPDLATWIDIGDSWEKTVNAANGYDMMVLRLTNSAIGGPKPIMFATTSIHAREYVPAELATRFAEMLIAGYGVDADITWLLDYHEIHLLLQANPDGRKMAETGLLWRKNTNENYCSPTSTNRGADLNRNFEFMWNGCGVSGCSSGNACDATYRGPSAASEPETQTIQSYGSTVFADVRPEDVTAAAPITTTGIYLDIHSYGEVVLWPWGYTATTAPNGPQLQTLGRKMAFFNGYEPDQAFGLYPVPTDGTTDDHFYGVLGVPAYTFELGTTFFQSCGAFESTILPDNLASLLYAAKAARAPYMLPAGPDAADVAVSQVAVAPGAVITVSATIDDTRYENQNGVEPTQAIAAAEFYVDTPYWITTTTPVALPMNAVDGSFDASSEAASATWDTSGLPYGRHTLYVRGQDSNGNWGAVSAVFIYILDPAVAPTIQGAVRDANSGLGLAATIDTDAAFSTTSNPASGAYALQVISGTYTLTVSSAGYATQSTTLSAADTQTIEQDFDLQPYCTEFEDLVETGVNGWSAQAPWSISTEASYSPDNAWSDSPGGNYGNNRDVSLTSPLFDLSGRTNTTIQFYSLCATEPGFDYCIVEARPDSGSSWTELSRWDGISSTWSAIALDAALLDGSATAQFRFRFTSDGSVTQDGWHVDNIRLLAVGNSCAPRAYAYLPVVSLRP